MGKQKDAGFRSRKWAAYVLTSIAIVLVGKLMHGDPTQVIFGLVSTLGLYLGGNVSQGYVDAKHGAVTASVGAPPATPAPAVTPTPTPTPAPTPAPAPPPGATPAPAPAPAPQEEGS